MLKKNDEIINIVCSLGSNGEGIIKHEDYTIFVPYALIGEKIKCKILKVDKNICYGKLIDILEPSKDRVKADCPVFTKCGGCQLQHLKYLSQLEYKKENVKRTFNKIANLNVEVNKVVCGEKQFRYRNKLQLPVIETEKGVEIGFYAEKSHRVIPIEDCLINPNWTSKIISTFKKFFEKFKVSAYNQITRKGLVREITVKEINNSLLIVLVCTKENVPFIENLIDLLKENLSLDFSFYINVNNSQSNVIYGERFIHIYGKTEYIDQMLGVKYLVGPQSFMQVNKEICEKLYSKVCELASLKENTTVIDAYSGAGLMTALLAQKSKKAIGIEIVKEAVDCANQLLANNALENKVKNYCGKCEDLLPQIVKEEKEKGAEIVVVLDPPRKGCDIKVIQSIIENQIDKVVYGSCMPSTLARDVGLLTGALEIKNNNIERAINFKERYKISAIIPFDMFPQTKHVETLVCLEKVKW